MLGRGRVVALTVSTLTGLLGPSLTSSPALASGPPEAPLTEAASEITSSSARLHGMLNPGKAGESGGYRFAYRQSPSECQPEANFSPESPALAMGNQKEAVEAPVTGLEPSATYTFCLVASNLSGESVAGLPAQTFTTAPEAPAVDGESVSESVFGGSTGATLETQINPKNQETHYAFEYSQQATGETLEGTVVKVTGQSALAAEFGDRYASVPTQTLAPGTKYFYRAVATDAKGEEGRGKVQSFTTVASPHTEAATAISATTAELHGTLAPLTATVAGEVASKYYFYYTTNEEGGSTETARSAVSATGNSFSGTTASVSATATELQPNATYTVQLVSINEFGQEGDYTTSPRVQFTTQPAPPAVASESVSGLTPYEATLEALINPNNEETSYSFEYAPNSAEIGTERAVHLKGASIPPYYGARLPVSVLTGRNLTPGQTYYYRVLADDAQSTSEHRPAEGKVEHFTAPPLEAPIVSEHVVSLGYDTASVEASIETNYQEATCKFEYALNASELGQAGATTVPCPSAFEASSQSKGTLPVDLGQRLQPKTTYHYRVVARNAAGESDGEALSFTTLIAPALQTNPAQGLTNTSATFSGTVNPSGVQTSCHYVYASQRQYEEGLQRSPEDPYVYGQSTSEVAVGHENAVRATEPQTVSTLAPGTVYHYALIADTTQETEIGPQHATVVGPGQTFQTAGAVTPSISEAQVAAVGQSEASFTASFDARGMPSRWELLLGDSPGQLRYSASSSVPGQAGATSVDLRLTALAPGTTYYYKLIVTNPEGTSESAEGSFTTQGAPPVQTLPLATFPQTPSLGSLVPAGIFANQQAGTILTTAKKAAKCPKGKRRSHGRCAKARAKRRHAGGKLSKRKRGAR